MLWSNQPKYIVKGQCYLTVGKINNTVSAWMTSLTLFSTDKPTVWTLFPQRVPSGIPLPPELKPPTRPKTHVGSVAPPQGNKSIFSFFFKRNPFSAVVTLICSCKRDIFSGSQQFFFHWLSDTVASFLHDKFAQGLHFWNLNIQVDWNCFERSGGWSSKLVIFVTTFSSLLYH